MSGDRRHQSLTTVVSLMCSNRIWAQSPTIIYGLWLGRRIGFSWTVLAWNLVTLYKNIDSPWYKTSWSGYSWLSSDFMISIDCPSSKKKANQITAFDLAITSSFDLVLFISGWLTFQISLIRYQELWWFTYGYFLGMNKLYI